MAENTEKKTCFVASVIGDHVSKDPEKVKRSQHADFVLKQYINPVIGELGYGKAIRGDQIEKSGYITNQIVEALQDCDLVIADLSFENQNVAYEIAIRHVVAKPIVHIAIEGTNIPFDIGNNRVIFFGYNYPKGQKFVSELHNHIKYVQENIPENPITLAIKFAEAKNMGGNEALLTYIDEGFQAMRNEIADLKRDRQPRYGWGEGQFGGEPIRHSVIGELMNPIRTTLPSDGSENWKLEPDPELESLDIENLKGRVDYDSEEDSEK